MKQQKKIMLTMGVATTMAIPVVLAATANQIASKTINNANYLQRGINPLYERGQIESIANQESFDIITDQGLFDITSARPLLVDNRILGSQGVGMIQDREGNYWATGKESGMYSLRRGQTDWEDTITHGNDLYRGTQCMFEDRDGNIWTMGLDAQMQILRPGETEWKNAGHGNKFTDVDFGVMFQDKEGNIWATAAGAPLQVLRVGQTEWEDAGHGNNMKNGWNAKIVQDRDGYIWTIGAWNGSFHHTDSMLQVLRKGQTEWEDAGHGNKLIGGRGNMLYEDRDGNIWTSSSETPLQVLRYGQTHWEEPAIGKKLKLEKTNMFQDRRGNHWLMGDGLPMQVLRPGQTEWEDAGHGNNMKNGNDGYMFEDREGNLWAMSDSSSLQVLRVGQTEWKKVGHGNNLKSRNGGSLFEDREGNLWAMSSATRPQVLKKGRTEWVDSIEEEAQYIEPANKEQESFINYFDGLTEELSRKTKAAWITADDMKDRIESNPSYFEEIFGIAPKDLIPREYKNTKFIKYKLESNSDHITIHLTFITKDANEPVKSTWVYLETHTYLEVLAHHPLNKPEKKKKPKTKPEDRTESSKKPTDKHSKPGDENKPEKKKKPKTKPEGGEKPTDKHSKPGDENKPEKKKKPGDEIESGKKPINKHLKTSSAKPSTKKHKTRLSLWVIVGIAAGGGVGLIMFISLLTYLIKKK